MTFELCAEKVRDGDADRFLSAMTAPADKRGNLFALYAFNLEIARAPWVTNEPMIAEMRLQFWRDVVDGAKDDTSPRAHEVAAPLAEVIRNCDLPLDALHAMIDARRWDVERAPFADETAFDAHIDATSGTLMALAARALGTGDVSAAREVGYASGVANWLMAIPAMEAAGRIPLVDGRPDAVQALAQKALARLREARQERVPKAACPALRAGWQAKPILKAAIANPELVAVGGLGQSEFKRRLGLLRRSATGGW